MFNLPKKNKGEAVKASDWNEHVDAIHEALARVSPASLVPSVTPAPKLCYHGSYITDAEGFSLRCFAVDGSGNYQAYLNPGYVLEHHSGGLRQLVPTIGGTPMNAAPPPAISAAAGNKLLLHFVPDDRGNFLKSAEIHTAGSLDAPANSLSVPLGEFQAVPGSVVGAIKYVPFQTGCIPFSHSVDSIGWMTKVQKSTDGSAVVSVVTGDIYLGETRLHSGDLSLLSAPSSGDIWLIITLDSSGNLSSFKLASSAVSGTNVYSILLATILTQSDPNSDNDSPLYSVQLHHVGAVFLSDLPNAGPGLEYQNDNQTLQIKIDPWVDTTAGVPVNLVVTDAGLRGFVELDADSGSSVLLADSWTALMCDSSSALRLNKDAEGKLYIQQGKLTVISNQPTYEPIN